MEITGILVKQTSIKTGVSKTNGNPWKIAEYLLEVPGQYPRHVNFRVSDGLTGRIARFDSLVGKNVTVSFDIDARLYNDRWFNEISAWGIMEYIDETTRNENIAAAATAKQQPTGNETAVSEPKPAENGQEVKDDKLPF